MSCSPRFAVEVLALNNASIPVCDGMGRHGSSDGDGDGDDGFLILRARCCCIVFTVMY